MTNLPVKKPKTNSKFQNFLEAFKDSQASGQTPAGRRPGAGEAFNFEEFLNQQEARIRRQERVRFEEIRREEQIVFSREKQQITTQIETLQIQIKQLAKETAGVMVEAEKAVFTAVTNPGTYHLNFFEKLMQLIKLARKKIHESKTWLQLFNHRSQCKSAYWQGVKTGGTKFMLSSDRTVATQAG